MSSHYLSYLFSVTHDKSWVCEDLLHHHMHKFNKEVDLSNCKKKKNKKKCWTDKATATGYWSKRQLFLIVQLYQRLVFFFVPVSFSVNFFFFNKTTSDCWYRELNHNCSAINVFPRKFDIITNLFTLCFFAVLMLLGINSSCTYTLCKRFQLTDGGTVWLVVRLTSCDLIPCLSFLIITDTPDTDV